MPSCDGEPKDPSSRDSKQHCVGLRFWNGIGGNNLVRYVRAMLVSDIGDLSQREFRGKEPNKNVTEFCSSASPPLTAAFPVANLRLAEAMSYCRGPEG